MEVSHTSRLALNALSIAVVLATWQLISSTGVLGDFLLPSIPSVLLRFYGDLVDGSLLERAGQTLEVTFAGFAIAAVLGLIIGIVTARVRFARWLFDPLISVGLPTPKIAFLPIFILWFGVFDELKIALVTFNCVFPIIVSAWAGADGVDEFLVWSARGMGARRSQVLSEVVLPAAAPSILTGLQVALPLSLIVTIVTEMATGGDGLGGAMIRATRLADSPGVFSGVLAVGLVGFALLKSAELIRRRLLAWHVETQR